MLFFDPEYTDDAPESGGAAAVGTATEAMALLEITEETKQKAEESLQNLLDLGGDDDDFGGASVLDLDTQLTPKDLKLLPNLGAPGILLYLRVWAIIPSRSCYTPFLIISN